MSHEPQFDKQTNLLADSEQNGIRVTKVYDIFDWLDEMLAKNGKVTRSNKLYQFAYTKSKTSPGTGGVSRYFNRPILYGPSGAAKKSKGNLKWVSIFDAAKYFAKAEYNLYNGLITNGRMNRRQALDFIDTNRDVAIGIAQIDPNDKDVLRCFQNLTEEARDMLEREGTEIKWTPTKRKEILNSLPKGKSDFYIQTFTVFGLNITTILGKGMGVSRGSREEMDEYSGENTLNGDEIAKRIMDTIDGVPGSSIPSQCSSAYRSYTANRMIASGNMNVIEFEVTDWDKFTECLNWMQSNDTRE